ncbi:hypothetical protein M3936_12445 [Sutcliffiella horikoshii]|uniref:hypothetical protein n=1 Tax=Sutcliffiella horikoshii TaxID=79883 RepID=UPI00203F5C80|nr:hypothetical protein [Sutcliffiella horikoshii]MCM3618391.1 hypothetical protein [Sutcliffiella horikoshii]
MNSIFVTTSVFLIAIFLFMNFSKMRPRKLGLIILILTVSGLFFIGFRFTAASALPFGSEVIKTIDTDYGKAVLYEDRNVDTFGIAHVNRTLGLLYYYGGGSTDYSVEEGEPFQAAGFGSKESFMVGVKTNDPTLKYIVIGSHLDTPEEIEKDNFSLVTVNEHPESYTIQEVVGGYAFFVLDEYSEATWTIRALDEDRQLIGEKMFYEGQARYVGE